MIMMGSATLLLLSVLLLSLCTFFLHGFPRTGPVPRSVPPIHINTRSTAGHGPTSEAWSELQVEKVSGEDNEGGGMRILAMEKLRFLLGLQTGPASGIADTTSTHPPSPSPAPSPATLPWPHALDIPLHSPLPSSGLIPLLQEEQASSNADRAKAMRIVMAVVLSTGTTTLVILCFAGALLCRRSRQRRAKRLEKMVQVSGIHGGSKGLDHKPQFSSPRALSSRHGNRLFFVRPLVKAKRQSSTGGRNVMPNENPLYSSSSNCGSVKCECNVDESNTTTTKASQEEETPVMDVVNKVDCAIPACNSRKEAKGSSSSSDSNTHVEICSVSQEHASVSPRIPVLPPQLHEVSTISPPVEQRTPMTSSINYLSQEDAKTLTQQVETGNNVPKPPPLPPPIQPQSKPGFKFSRHPPPLPPLPTLLLQRPSRPKPIATTVRSTRPGRFPPAPSQPPSVARAGKEALSRRPPPPPVAQPREVNGSETSGRPPPPPSAQLGMEIPPLPKLKPLHWDKVRAAPNQTMVWNKIRSSSFELDEEMIESLFGYNAQVSAKNEEAVSSSKSSYTSKHVLEPQRLRNFTILLKALNATNDQVCEALSKGSGLSAQQLEVLAKMVPSKEEEMKLLSYDGDVNELDPVEKFLASILRVPFSFLKIEVLLYAETFDDEVTQIGKSFQMLEEACKELRSSRLFLKLLEAVLRTGNRMNAGTMRGGARAFRLDALLKLVDVKGTDGKTTLLHFIVKEVIKSECRSNPVDTQADKAKQKEEDHRSMALEFISALNSDLVNVKKSACFDFKNLTASISNLSDGMAKLKHLIIDKLPMEGGDGSFEQTMNGFRMKCERTIGKLKEDERLILQKIKDITEYFHGEMSKDEVNQLFIFVVVRDFLNLLDQTCKEIGSSKKSLSPNCPGKRVLF